MALIGNFVDGTVLIEDGTGTPLDVLVNYCQGDFSASGFKAAQNETAAYTSRGALVGLRKTNPMFPTGSVSFMFDEFNHATNETVVAMIKGLAPFASRISTTVALGDVITFDLTFTSSEGGSVKLEDCELSFDFSEGDPSTVSLSWTQYGATTFTAA